MTGIGHETDFTIADFVADVRSPTPSAAAAAVVPDRADALDQLATRREWLTRRMAQQLQYEEQRLTHHKLRLQRIAPVRQLDLRRQQLDHRLWRLTTIIQRKLERWQARNKLASTRLVALSPTAVLRRGYSIVRRSDGTIITAPPPVSQNELLTVHSAGGVYQVRAVDSS